jgi:branched-chain amino acid transport system substrate-binding protein
MKAISTLLLLLCCATGLRADESIKILVLYAQSYTEVEDFNSAEDWRGALLAAERINEAGGVGGRKLELINGLVRTLEEGQALLTEMIKQDEITAVIGGNMSNLSMLIAPVLQRARIPMVSPISTHPRVTAIGDYIFRACFTNPFQGTLMARFAAGELNARSAVILTKATSSYSLSLANNFKSAYPGQILNEEYYDADQSDFSELLSRTAALNPEVVIVPGHAQDAGLIMKQARNMGLSLLFLGGDGWGKGALGIAGAEAAEGHYFVNPWHPEVATPESREFFRLYRNKYSVSTVAGSAAMGYDALGLLADAIERAGTTDRRKLRDAIAITREFRGATGIITLDSTGDPVGKQGVVQQYRNGEIIFSRTITP